MSIPAKNLQLEMVRGPEPAPAARLLPPGYRMRQIAERDRGSYWRLFAQVFYTNSRLDDLRTRSLPGGFFVVEHLATGDIVASAVAAEYERHGHTGRASLQWVMADDAHTGKGLGTAVVATATARLAETGSRAYLSTDDWRLPAINIYLTLGWRPFLFEPGMEPRWRSVLDALGRPFSLNHCAT